LTGGTEGTLKIGRKILLPEGSHVCKDLIRRVVAGFFFPKNEYVSIRKLRVTLEKTNSLKKSKYKLCMNLVLNMHK
jgi:hypothetical protein